MVTLIVKSNRNINLISPLTIILIYKDLHMVNITKGDHFIIYLSPLISYLDKKFQTNSDVF
jgi:hypothetical protein